jgi:hypothetical protein
MSSTWAAKLDTLHTSLTTGTRMANLDNLSVNVNTLGTAANLALAAKENTPLLDTPIASGFIPADATTGSQAIGHLYGCGIITTDINNATTTVTYTGQGVLEFCALGNISAGSNESLTLVIDGVTVFASGSFLGNATVEIIVCPVGAANRAWYWTGSALSSVGSMALGAVPFKTSFTITAIGTTSSNGYLYYKYRKTA